MMTVVNFKPESDDSQDKNTLNTLEPLDNQNSQESEQLLGRVLAGKANF